MADMAMWQKIQQLLGKPGGAGGVTLNSVPSSSAPVDNTAKSPYDILKEKGMAAGFKAAADDKGVMGSAQMIADGMNTGNGSFTPPLAPAPVMSSVGGPADAARMQAAQALMSQLLNARRPAPRGITLAR